MDFQYYGPDNPYGQPMQDKRSASMATAALILSVISLVSCTCLYISIVCGSLAIILALLSKGGELTLSRNAKIALGIGSAALAATIVLYAVSFAMLIAEYGSLEAYLETYLNDYGMSLEDMIW